MTPRSVTTPNRREHSSRSNPSGTTAGRTTGRSNPGQTGRSGTFANRSSTGSATQTATRPATSGTILTECIEACNETLSYCLEQGGDHVDRDHILSLLDCVDTCWYVTGLQSRDSQLVGDALKICADACKSCEESCEEFGDDETMRRCADACRECHEYCSR